MPPRRQPALAGFMFLWGAYALVAQSVLLRETMVLFFGGELSWGLVLFAWLFGIALGATAGVRLAGRAGRPAGALAATAGTFALLVPLAVLALRCCRAWLGIGPGQYIPIATTAALAIATVAPCGAMIGLAFPLAVAVLRGAPGSAGRQIGWVYLVESAGSLAGGVAFTFWLVDRFDPFSCSLVLGGAAMVALVLVEPRWGLARLASAAVGLSLVTAGLGGAGKAMHLASVQRRWNGFASGIELIESRDSKYQNLAIGHLVGQLSVYANGRRLTDFPRRWGDYRLATHIAVSQHPFPRRVLLLGGGADGVLAEILHHRSVRQVDYVELDPVLLEMIRPYLPKRDRLALADPRVRVHHADVRQFVKTAAGGYDLILATLPSPASAQLARFYTGQFYRELRRIMTADGVYVFQAEASPAELRPESRRYLACLVATLKTVFDDVLVEWGVSPQIFACPRVGVLSIDPDVLVQRFERHGAALPELERDLSASADRRQLYRAFFAGCDWLEARHVAARRGQIDSYRRPVVYTDMRPAAYLDWLIWWDKQQRGPSARLFELLQAIKAWQVLLGGLAGLGLWQAVRLLAGGGRGRLLGDAVLLSIATTGLATMALEIVLLFAFQSLYGYVYQRIGLIVATFMFGLVAGSGWMNRLLRRRPSGSLGWMVRIDLLLALLAGLLPASLQALGRLQAWAVPAAAPELAVFALVAVAGLLGGLAFPLAAALQVRAAAQPIRIAGGLEAADHAGACVGALATGLLLVPVFGLAVACWLLATLKSLSAGWLLLAGWLQRRV